MNIELTGHESGHELIRQLAYLRLCARLFVRQSARNREIAGAYEQAGRDAPEALKELDLQIRFSKIEIGQYLLRLCPELDRKASREAVFEALNVNVAHRNTDDVRKYGDTTGDLIFVLDLEDSATKDDSPDVRPLKECYLMALFQAMKTDERVDRMMHDGANEFFGGIFGEYRERPLTERLVG